MEMNEIKAMLADRNLKIVADAAGVPYHRLTAFMRGEVEEPSYTLIVGLIKYLESQPQFTKVA